MAATDSFGTLILCTTLHDFILQKTISIVITVLRIWNLKFFPSLFLDISSSVKSNIKLDLRNDFLLVIENYF
jgi:hypothetical protein